MSESWNDVIHVSRSALRKSFTWFSDRNPNEAMIDAEIEKLTLKGDCPICGGELDDCLEQANPNWKEELRDLAATNESVPECN